MFFGLRPAARDERGAAAVEMAVVLLPLLLILLGIVEFGRVYSTQLRLQHAAREAAREIALKHDDPGVLDLGLLPGLVENTLNDLVGDLLDDLTTKNIVYCNANNTVPNARVALGGDIDLVLPLPGDQLDSVPVAAEAVMACEA